MFMGKPDFEKMKREMRNMPLGEALDRGFHLQSANGETWLCLGQWRLQKVEMDVIK